MIAWVDDACRSWGFYVYELIDPRDGSVFYVGKGKGNRCDSHVNDAKNGGIGKKAERIRAIIEAGFEVTTKLVAWFEDEDDAFAYEKVRIAKRGMSTLTNLSKGRSCSAYPKAANDWSEPLHSEWAETMRALKARNASQSEIQAAWESWESKCIKAVVSAVSEAK